MKSKRVRHGLKWAVCSALLSASTFAAVAPRDAQVIDSRRLASLDTSVRGITQDASGFKLHPSLQGASGRTQVLVRLKGDAVSKKLSTSSRGALAAQQAAFIDRALATAPSAEVVGTMQFVLNAVLLEVDAADLPALARDTAITRMVAIANYSQDLSETVPYIGASTAHSLGVTGKGIRIAVIDSGIDYTHAALGGAGTQAAYEKAWAPLPAPGQPAIPSVPAGTGYLAADPALFPTSKVIGGYDFVGESWPNGPRTEDNNPIGAPDATTNGGHGTHVADIIAGKLGVAPDAKLYALKVCSAPATSCNGIALMKAMEWSVDPNGDGDPSDHVDIINMSLGSNYGQPFDDDLSAAVDAAFSAGVLTVASAGNAADKQFVTGSPAASSAALSVAQTAVPSASLQIMELLAPVTGNRGAVAQPWAAKLTTTIEGPAFVAGPSGSGKRLGCANAAGGTPYTAGELTGKIVYVDRGTCSFSLKIANIKAAGGILGIIGVVTADAPFAGANGGGDASIPAFMISNADAAVLRPGNAVVRFSPSGNLSLAGSLASTSSRGPRFDDSIVKPEIGAPGASVSARSGSFTGTAAFGGTSGAAPMVTGAAALVMEARRNIGIDNIKQVLINTAETNVFQPSAGGSVFPDQLAPISRIGGGEVRVDKALLSPSMVSDSTGDYVTYINGAMSFGYLDASKEITTLKRRLTVENHSNKTQTYAVTPTLRYANDNTGAVTMSVSPTNVSVPPGSIRYVQVKLTVDGAKVRNNLMNSGERGNAIGPLTANEYDGYIVLNGADHTLKMPWHILPRRSADVSVKIPYGQPIPIDDATGTAAVEIRNKGVGDAQISAYSLLGRGDDREGGEHGEGKPTPDIRAVGMSTVEVPAGFCAAEGSFLWSFAFNMYERKASPVGTIHEVDLDVDNNGSYDFAIINQDLSGITTLTDGRQVSAVIDLATGASVLEFFVEHATNSSNVVLTACGSDLGLSLADKGKPVKALFQAYTWYFDDPANPVVPPSVIDGGIITPFGEEYTGSMPGDVLAGLQSGTLTVKQHAPYPGTTKQQGLMLINNSDFSFATGNTGAATRATEALILPSW
jgi:minor extracellular serine protease Vpr